MMDSAIPQRSLKKVNLEEKFGAFDDRWTPKIVAELNGQYVKLAKIQGNFVWHQHEHEDELFFVHKGTLKMHLRDRTVVLEAGDLFVVPKGVEHCPEADEETEILLFEPKVTAHTGEVKSDKTVAVEQQEWI